jgi:hypothetical protein
LATTVLDRIADKKNGCQVGKTEKVKKEGSRASASTSQSAKSNPTAPYKESYYLVIIL